VADLLPFSHAVDLGRAALASDPGGVLSHLPWVCGYAIVFFAAAVFAFYKGMKH
jgi:ABC-2 type transport system permease protein